MSPDRDAFVVQESDLWDYKAEWPFSYSDDYCGGIIRLIQAFHNSFGGLIIFGINDESKKHSKTKINANIEKLNALLKTHLERPLVCQHRPYDLGEFGHVDVLLVPRKAPAELPIRQREAIGRYAPQRLWVRRSHEVLEAGPQDLTLLYGAFDVPNPDSGLGGQLLGYIPPKPSTLRQFVGRMLQLDALFNWLLHTDEPRSFLFGRGGSGKTTIAYEFASFIRSYGDRLVGITDEAFDIVIFVSAKERSLNPLDQTSYAVFSDFATELELYQAILVLAEYASVETIDSLDVAEARKEIQDLLNTFSCLFVIDDVDTLTTKGTDLGFEFMFRAACKSNKNTKILYTMRNAPTQALSNSIEVPGLKSGVELDEFLEACARQFNVEIPKGDELLRRFEEISERRPLIIETIMGMRRSCSSFEQALDFFQERGGDEARRYAFSREWEALPPDNQARNLLTAVALYGKPVRLDDLAIILQMDGQSVMSGIASVQEMFLVREAAHDDTKFSMGRLTADFVLSESKALTYHGKIAARVKFYKQHEYRKPQAVAVLEIKCAEAVKRYHAGHALQLITAAQPSEVIAEHPAFRALSGWVYCNQVPPMLPSAREAFDYCMKMDSEIETRYLHNWFWAEKNAGFGGEICDKICEWVISSKHYGPSDKAAFALKSAIVQFERSKDIEFVNPIDARDLLRDALYRHLRSYSYHLQIDMGDFAKAHKYTQDTAFKYFTDSIHAQRVDDIFDFWKSLPERAEVSSCGPLVDPMIFAMGSILRRVAADDKRRYVGRANQLRELLKSGKLKFDFEEDRVRALAEVEAFQEKSRSVPRRH